VKRIGPVVLLLVMALPATARAQGKSDPLEQGKSDPLEGTLSQKVEKKDPFYGLGLRLGFRMGTGVNMEPESAYLNMYYQFKATWKFGYLITKKGWAKLLNLNLRFNLSHQPVGSAGLYRTGSSDPNIALASSETLPIADGGGLLSLGNRAVPRTVDGAPRTARISDVMLTLAHGKLFMIPKAKIAFDGLVRLMFPASVMSRNSTMLLALTAALGASRAFKFKAGKVKQTLTVGYTFGFTKYFHSWKTGKLDTREAGFYVYDQYVNEPYHGDLTTLNPNYAVSNDFFVTYAFYKSLSLTLSYGLLAYRTYKLDNCVVPLDPTDPGLTANLCDTMGQLPSGREPVGLRDFHGFSAAVTYSPLPYLGLQLALMTQTPLRTPDSRHLYQPFFQTNRNGFTSIMLTAYLTLEKLYTTLTGKKKKADSKAVQGDPKANGPTASR
jgi:hypothetical protein